MQIFIQCLFLFSCKNKYTLPIECRRFAYARKYIIKAVVITNAQNCRLGLFFLHFCTALQLMHIEFAKFDWYTDSMEAKLLTKTDLCKNQLHIDPRTFKTSWPDCPCVILGASKKHGGYRVRYILADVMKYIKEKSKNQINI